MTNKWNLGWRSSARIRYGMNWKAHAPTLDDYPQATTYAIRLLLVAALWGWAMNADHAEQMAREAAQAIEAAADSEARLLECMNGRAYWKTEDGEEVACMRVEANKRRM